MGIRTRQKRKNGKPVAITRQPLNRKQQQMVADNIGLARCMTLKFVSGRHFEETDVYADALYGLTNAAKKFIPERGFKFSTYACRAIYNTICAGYNHRNRHRPMTGTDIVFEETTDDNCDPRAAEQSLRENRRLANRFMKGLPRRERRIIELRFLKNLTLKETGKIEGISRERVRQLQSRAIVIMRKKHPGLIKRYAEACDDD